MIDIQETVDSLAESLGRPVVVDDSRFRSIAYSPHHIEVDPVRRASILERQPPQEVVAWLLTRGVRDAEELLRLPANPELLMLARICIPIRFDDALLGFLWLIDDPPLSEDELEESCICADQLGVELYRARRLEHENRERQRMLLQQLLRVPGDAGERAAAAEAIVAEGWLSASGCYAALVVGVQSEAGEAVPARVRVRLGAVAERIRRKLSPGQMIVLLNGAQLVAVLAYSEPNELNESGNELARAAAASLPELDGLSVLVASGEGRSSPRELPESHAEAMMALKIGRALGYRRLVNWSALGVYRLLADLVGERDPARLLPKTFTALLEAQGAATLIATLESFLDHGGQAHDTASALYIHRSSLYERLHRIERIVGANLSSGATRLELHLALRLWRLGGGIVDAPLGA